MKFVLIPTLFLSVKPIYQIMKKKQKKVKRKYDFIVHCATKSNFHCTMGTWGKNYTMELNFCCTNP